MTALSRDLSRKTRDGARPLNRVAIATGSKIYRGSLVARRNTTGRAVAASAATGRRILGLAVGFEGPTGTGTGNTGGTEYVQVEAYMPVLVDIRTAIRTNTALGLNVFISDDNTVGGTAVGTSAARVVAGELIEFEASNKSTGWVFLRRNASTNIAV